MDRTTLSHLFVHVSDLARSKAFYARVGFGDGFSIGMEERPLADVGAA